MVKLSGASQSWTRVSAWTRFKRRTFHDPNLSRNKAEPNWIDSDSDLNSSQKKFKKEKNAHFCQTAFKIRYNNSCIRFGTWKIRRLNQGHSKVDPKSNFPAGLGGKKAEAFLTDSDAERFKYLMQSVRFGSWKVRRLNRALVFEDFKGNPKVWPRKWNILRSRLKWQYSTINCSVSCNKKFWVFSCCNSWPLLNVNISSIVSQNWLIFT